MWVKYEFISDTELNGEHQIDQIAGLWVVVFPFGYLGLGISFVPLAVFFLLVGFWFESE